jgi:hypothetical protein
VCNVVSRRIALTGVLALLAAACSSGRASPAAVSAPAVLVAPSTTTEPSTTTTEPAASTTTSTSSTLPAASAPPPPIRAAGWVIGAGDSLWSAAGRAVGAGPAVYTTILHRAGTSAPIAVSWLDTGRLRLALFAGSSQPPGTWSQQGAVPAAQRSGLVAAFNSGFQLGASRGGWYLDGRSAIPLRAGAASLVIYQDGSATVGVWGRDAALTPDVKAVRQNLTLMVDHGAPVAGLATDILGAWGATLGHVVVTWRSAIGVDAAGQLLYVAGPALDPATLAGALVAAGAARAMELDINPEWVSFDSFAGVASGVAATKLLPTMSFSPLHFLTPFWRDFFAVFART